MSAAHRCWSCDGWTWEDRPCVNCGAPPDPFCEGCEGFQDGRNRTGCARCGLSFTKGGDERWQAAKTARPTTTVGS
jgi:hypothetical protein